MNKSSCWMLLLGLALLLATCVPARASDVETQDDPRALLLVRKITDTNTPQFEVPVYSVGSNVTVTIQLFNQGKGCVVCAPSFLFSSLPCPSRCRMAFGPDSD